MRTEIIAIKEKETFNGLQRGFELNEKEEDGTNRIYFPFFQNLVTPDAIGKSLCIFNNNGLKKEFIH